MFGREANIPLDLIYETPEETPDQDRSIYGQEMEERMQLIYKYMRENQGAAVERARMDYGGKLQGKPLAEDQLVWLYTPVIDKTVGPKYSLYWTGPWIITEKISDVTFEIKTTGDWNLKKVKVVVSIDRLKHYKENPDRVLVPMNLTLQDVSMSDEFVEQAVDDPNLLPQFRLPAATLALADRGEPLLLGGGVDPHPPPPPPGGGGGLPPPPPPGGGGGRPRGLRRSRGTTNRRRRTREQPSPTPTRGR